MARSSGTGCEFNTLGDLIPLPTARDSDSHSDTDIRRRRVMFGSSCMAEFDMFHPLGVIVNFAQEAIIASLRTGGESGCSHASHVSAVAQVASSGVAGRMALNPTRIEGTEWMDKEKLSIPLIEPFIHIVLAFMNGGQEPRMETAMSAKRSDRGEVLT